MPTSKKNCNFSTSFNANNVEASSSSDDEIPASTSVNFKMLPSSSMELQDLIQNLSIGRPVRFAQRHRLRRTKRHRVLPYPQQSAAKHWEKPVEQLKLAGNFCDVGDLIKLGGTLDVSDFAELLPYCLLSRRRFLPLSVRNRTQPHQACSTEARQSASDVSVTELAAYLDEFLSLPRKMSHMAESMYA